jgi:mannose/fructose/N-acetylgalactosamine-specific phosphotransferase system component IIC
MMMIPAHTHTHTRSHTTTDSSSSSSSPVNQSTSSMDQGTLIGVAITAVMSLIACVLLVLLIILYRRKRRIVELLHQQHVQITAINATLPPHLHIPYPVAIGIYIQENYVPAVDNIHHLSVTRASHVDSTPCDTPKSVRLDGSRRNSIHA